MHRFKLFCFPFAGGSASYYLNWKPYMKSGVELIPVELPGRGSRISDPLCTTLEDMVEDALKFVESRLDGSGYAFFGHSMGAMLAFELTHRIRQKGLALPAHLFFSGRRAPHLPPRLKGFASMTPEEFKEAVLELGGTPAELFESPELSELFVPIMRNDFILAESGIDLEGKEPFTMGLTVFIGKDEDILPEESEGWKLYSDKRCTIHYFKGGHFFLTEHTKEVIQLINLDLPKKPVRATLA
ncbi:MAG: alpha/beta fold hydrolase [Cyclobacteriaceae bacterium]